MSEQIKHFYEFGPFRLDPLKRRLMRDGEVVRLTPKALELLLVLVEANGKTVEKDQLLEKVWAGTIVEENNLNQNITALRKSLGDSRQDSQYIATIPGVGYRFVADVRKRDGEIGRVGDGVMGGVGDVSAPPPVTPSPTLPVSPSPPLPVRRSYRYTYWPSFPLSPSLRSPTSCTQGKDGHQSLRSWFCRWRTSLVIRSRNTSPME